MNPLTDCWWCQTPLTPEELKVANVFCDKCEELSKDKSKQYEFHSRFKLESAIESDTMGAGEQK